MSRPAVAFARDNDEAQVNMVETVSTTITDKGQSGKEQIIV
jgi:hypothetical protein